MPWQEKYRALEHEWKQDSQVRRSALGTTLRTRGLLVAVLLLAYPICAQAVHKYLVSLVQRGVACQAVLKQWCACCANDLPT